MQKRKLPRRPTDKERQALIDLLETELCYEARDYEDLEDLSIAERVSQATIAVFDDFAATETDYIGKVMVVVWDFGPECYEVFGWVGNQLVGMPQDSRFAA